MQEGIFTVSGTEIQLKTFCNKIGISETKGDFSMNQVIEFNSDKIQQTAQTTIKFSNHFSLPNDFKKAFIFANRNYSYRISLHFVYNFFRLIQPRNIKKPKAQASRL